MDELLRRIDESMSQIYVDDMLVFMYKIWDWAREALAESIWEDATIWIEIVCNISNLFNIATDPSEYALEAVLSQEGDGGNVL